MSSSSTDKSKGQGDFQLWDNIWESSVFHYTKTTPKTLIGLWQKGYFTDLWSYAKPTATTAKFLELGSGRATTSMYLLEKGCDVTLVDLSSKAFLQATHCCQKYDLNLPTFIQADVRQTNLPANQYDFIYNIGLLEHFLDPQPVLDEAFRLLKPGGMIFMVIVPELSWRRKVLTQGWLNPWRLFRASASRIIKKIRDKKTEVNEMTRTSLTNEAYITSAQNIGYRDVQCMPYNPFYPIYDTQFLKEHIELPLYLSQYTGKIRAGEPPFLQTSERLAFCQLLVGWKEEQETPHTTN